ncbi:hypothetical protein EIP86_008505 [Pleurotus ostreatoroseus]|nr:hypothetical protein EIP86_008505 [Pleurotus ostreatoroseus]
MHIFSKDKTQEISQAAPSPKERDVQNGMTYDYSSGHAVPKDSALTTQETAEGANDAKAGASEANDARNIVGATDYATGQRQEAHSVGAKNPAPASDSGYSSSSPRNVPRTVEHEGLQPVPVVWTNADGAREDTKPTPIWKRTKELGNNVEEGGGGDRGSDVRRSQSLLSFRPSHVEPYGDNQHTESLGQRTPRRRASLNVGSFASGAGTIGPNAVPEGGDTDIFRSRSLRADAELSKKQKHRIAKDELKESKRVVNVIKREGKAEKKALEVAVKEMEDIQRMQKNSIKEEAKTNAAYAQALRTFRNEEKVYLAARSKYVRAQADLQVFEDSREASRDHAQRITEMLQEKNREVEWLRAQKAADDVSSPILRCAGVKAY